MAASINTKEKVADLLEQNRKRDQAQGNRDQRYLSTTLNTYSHITDEMRQRAAVKIDRGIAKAEITEQEEKLKERTMTTFQARKRWSRKAG